MKNENMTTMCITLSRTLLKELSKEWQTAHRSRSAYVEHLLRSHPNRNVLFDAEGNPKSVEEACDE